MFQNYDYFIGAVVILIPLTSISHFIPPLSFCLLADICNHTWIPECGVEDYDYRIFLDECDLWEYNCDYKRNFSITNYSDCFLPAAQTCPPIPTCPACPTCPTLPAGRMGKGAFGKLKINGPMYTQFAVPHTHHPPGMHGFKYHGHPYAGIYFRKYNVTMTIFTGLKPDRTPGHRDPHRRRYNPEAERQFRGYTSITKPMTRPRNSRRTSRITKEVIRTGTTAMFRRHQQTAVLKVFTVIKDGRMVVKVIKGRVSQKTTRYFKDSDFLEK